MEESSQPSHDYEVLGISLFGPPPIGVVHLRWEPSLFVLYGKNGSGKTAVLQGLQAALTGNLPPSRGQGISPTVWTGHGGFLHVRLAGDATPIRWEPEWEYFAKDLLGAIAKSVKNQILDPSSQSFVHTSLDQAWTDYETMLSSDDPTDTVRAALTLQLGQGNSDLIEEIASQQVFSLQAHGRGWEVYAATLISGETPEANKFLKQLQSEPAGGVPLESRHKRTTPVALRFLEGVRPGWTPVPIAHIGYLQSTNSPAVFVPSTESPNRLTQGFLKVHLDEFHRHVFAPYYGYEPEDDSELSPLLRRLSDSASQHLAGLLKDAPVLALNVDEIMFEEMNQYVSWSAWDTPTATAVPLSALSEAQQRWASVAIQWALWNQQPHGHHSAMLIDEPEQALHSQAIQHLLNDLQETPASIRGPVFVATHSAQFLTASKATLLHVRRGADGLTEVVPMDAELRSGFHSASEQLGLKMADLLQLVRVFLLVEGKHDIVVLEETIGDELREAQVHMLPILGTPNAVEILESELLLDFTDAYIMLALDKLRVGTVTSAWLKAQEAVRREDWDSAKGALTRILHKSDVSKEEKTALRFCLKAIDIRQAERVQVRGLSEPDILNYLPVKSFFPDEESWDRPTAAWRREQRPLENMKTWMLRTIQDRRRRPTIPNLQKAARQLQTIPPEFTDLLEACRTLAKTPPPSRSRS